MSRHFTVDRKAGIWFGAVVVLLSLGALTSADRSQTIAFVSWVPVGLAAGLITGRPLAVAAPMLFGIGVLELAALWLLTGLPTAALLATVSGCLAAALAAWLWRATGADRLANPNFAVLFIFIAMLSGLVVGMGLAPFADRLSGTSLAVPYLVWAFSVTSSLLCEAPFILLLREGRTPQRVLLVDAVVGETLLIGALWAIFFWSPPGSPGLWGWPYLVLIGMTWLALRSGLLITTLSNAFFGVVMYVSTVGGYGPFVRSDADPLGQGVPVFLGTVVFVAVILLITVAIGEGAELEHRLKQRQLVMAERAAHDPLTGLLSRDGLHVEMSGSTRGSARRAWTGLVLLDLDDFKQVNDTAGHLTGDRLLTEVAARMKQTVREGDLLARFGGDEFVIVLNQLPASSVALDSAVRLREAVIGQYAIDGRLFEIHASAGVAAALATDAELFALLRSADLAMYEAKRSGRGVVAYDERLGVALRGRVTAQNTIESALSENRVRAAYQPIVRLHDGELVGVEALARIDVDGSEWLPAQFIPVAESTKQIVALGRRIAHIVASQTADAATHRPGGVLVSVNVSTAELVQAEYAFWLLAELRSVGFPPDALVVEVTESALIDEDGQALRTLVDLRSSGVRVSLDDFGTGWSSLSRLVDCPVDQIKIDQSFTAHMLSQPKPLIVVKTVIDISHQMGVPAVAEGIESPEQLRVLQDLGCELGQGWHLGRPASLGSVL